MIKPYFQVCKGNQWIRPLLKRQSKIKAKRIDYFNNEQYSRPRQLLQLNISNKYLSQAINNFKIGEQHVIKIRNNLDAIHKIMVKVKRILKRQDYQQKHKSQQIINISMAISSNIQDQMKQSGEMQIQNAFMQKNRSTQINRSMQKMSQNCQNKEDQVKWRQSQQIQKIMGYYELIQKENSQGQLQKITILSKVVAPSLFLINQNEQIQENTLKEHIQNGPLI